MASLGLGKGPMGAHWKPGGLTKQVMGTPPLRMGEDPMDFYIQNRNPYSRDSAAAVSAKRSNARGMSGMGGGSWGNIGLVGTVLNPVQNDEQSNPRNIAEMRRRLMSSLR